MQELFHVNRGSALDDDQNDLAGLEHKRGKGGWGLLPLPVDRPFSTAVLNDPNDEYCRLCGQGVRFAQTQDAWQMYATHSCHLCVFVMGTVLYSGFQALDNA